MPDGTIDISEEEFMKKYLGLTPRSILLSSDLLEDSKWDDFWSSVKTTIATSDLMNPLKTDTEEQKKEKARIKERALKFVDSWNATASDRRSGLKEDSQFIRSTKGYVAEFEKIYEGIVGNDVVRIGQTLFGPENLDPTDMRISEMHSVERLSTLRSDTDAAVKLPRSFTQVTVDLIFTGTAQINQRFRPMLAELFASPVTTMESSLLTAAVVNHFAMPELEQEIKNRVYALADKSTIDGFDTKLDEASNSFAKLREIFKNDDLLLEYFREREKRRADAVRPGADKTVTVVTTPPPIGVAVPVVFQNIVVTTDPTSPNTIHVRLTFMLFNSRAFGAYGIEYRDNAGNRTTDIMRCGVLRRYIEWAFMSSASRPDYGQPFLGEYTAETLDGKPDFACRWRDLVDVKMVRDFPKDDDHFVVNSVQASLDIKSVPIPLIGSKFPTTQILGRSNVEGRIVLQTTSLNVLRQFSLMKDHVDAISRNVGGQYRDEYVDVQNSVLNVMGARRFIITGVDISPIEDTSNGYEISMNLLQAEYSFKSQQALIFKDETVPGSLLRDFWKHLVKKAKEVVTGSPVPDGTQVSADAEAQLAFNTLFGTQREGKDSGVINADVLIAGILRIYATQYGMNPSSQDLIFKIYEDEFDVHPRVVSVNTGAEIPVLAGTIPSAGELEEKVGQKFLQVVGDPGFTRTRSVPFGPGDGPKRQKVLETGPLGVMGKFVKGMISGDEVLGTGGYAAFRAIQGYMKFPSLVDRSGEVKSYAWFTDQVWDNIIEALLDMRSAPREVESLSKKEANSNQVYNTESLVRGLSNLTGIFTADQISKFSFDATAYADKLGKGNLTVMDANTAEAAKRRTISNYPDIPLPTYAELFTGEFDKVVDDGRGSKVELWTRFSPTYFDLGVIPPEGFDIQFSHKVARKKSDVMEPGFWFHHQRSREEQLKRAVHAIKFMDGQTIKDIDKHKVSLDVGHDDLMAMSEKNAKETLYSMLTEAINNDEKIRKKVDSARKADRRVEIVDHDGRDIAAFVPKGPRAANGEFDVEMKIGRRNYQASLTGRNVYEPHDEAHNTSLATRILQSTADNTLSMTRMFPAFRVWFVEWDDNQGRNGAEKLSGRVVRLLDDLYTSNAIVSLHITDSKDDGSVAEVMVLNTVGTFDMDSFLMPSEAKEISLKQGTQPIGPDDEGEGFLKRMKLQTGTGIVIQMGYSSDVNSLKTVFTGSITEIEPGKVIRFVAQGYKAELDQDVDIVIDRDNNAEAVRELVQIGVPSMKNPTPHLGRVYDSTDLDQAMKIQLWGSYALQETGVFGLQGPGGLWAQWFGQYVNSSLRNVYVQSTNGTQNWFGRQLQNFSEWRLWQAIGFGSADEEWHFSSKTAWQGLQEMTRHMPGTIVAVRPYDNEATVFFGQPEQPYQFREPRFMEMSKWSSQISAPRISAVVGLYTELLAKFWGSDFGTTNQLKLDRDVQNAKIVGSVNGTGESSRNWGWKFLTYYYGGTYVAQQRKSSRASEARIVDEVSESYLGYLKWADSIGSHIDAAGFTDAVSKLDPGQAAASGWTNNAIYETLGLDFTNDWDSLDPELQRFLLFYFYRLPYWNAAKIEGDFESNLKKLVDSGMGPLINVDNSPNDTFDNWVRLTQGMNADGTFKNVDHFASVYTPDASWDDMKKMLSDAMARVATDLRLGLIDTAEAVRRINEYSQLLTKVVNTPDISSDQFLFNLRSVEEAPFLTEYSTKGKNLGEILFSYFPRFRLFIHYFANWRRDDLANMSGAESLKSIEQVRDNVDVLKNTALAPWMKQFRDYHVVFSNHDIVDNSIVASMEEMYNTFVIRHPGKALPVKDENIQDPNGGGSFITAREWKSYPDADGFPFHKDLKRSQRKLAVCLEPNANTRTRTANVLLTNVCEGMRGMYRGELKIVGRVVMPWDVVGIVDEVDGMMGVIEVDRVTHEFTSETGWITTIVPHAYCHPQNPYGLWQLTTAFDWLSFIDTGMNLLTIVGSVLIVFKVLAAAGALARASALEGFIAKRGLVSTSGQDILLSSVGRIELAASEEVAASSAAEGVRRIMATEAKAMADDFIAKGALPVGFNAAAQRAGTTAGVGKFLARHWLGTLATMGRTFGLWSLANEGVAPAASLCFGLGTKSRVHNLEIPVDLRVLTYKGMPLTAGLDLDDGNFDSFDTRFSGFFGEFTRTMDRWMFDLVKPVSIPANQEPPR